MTRLIIHALTGLLISAGARAQVTKPSQDTLTLVCHRWEITKLVAEGQSVPMSGNIMDFHKDGTGLFSDDVSQKEHQESWNYNHTKRLLFIETKEYRLIQLNSNTMVLYDSSVKGSLYFKRLD